MIVIATKSVAYQAVTFERSHFRIQLQNSSPETVLGQGDLVIKLDVSLFETHLITSRFHCNLLLEWRDVGNVMVFAQLQHCS